MPCCTVFPQSQCSLYFSFCLPSLCSGLVLLLGTVLEDLGELVVVKHSILDRRLSVHLVNLEHNINLIQTSDCVMVILCLCDAVWCVVMPRDGATITPHNDAAPGPDCSRSQVTARHLIIKDLTSSSVNLSPMVVSSSLSLSSCRRPTLSSSKHPNAFLMTSSGSVPW